MREIKFRVWDKLHKRLANVLKINFLSEEVILDDLEDVWTIDFKNIVLEQYTGLKDKNGKEIYEGDILKYLSFEEKNYYLRVFYSTEYASFQMGWVKTNYATHNGEVVGNIHENADLLEES